MSIAHFYFRQCLVSAVAVNNDTTIGSIDARVLRIRCHTAVEQTWGWGRGNCSMASLAAYFAHATLTPGPRTLRPLDTLLQLAVLMADGIFLLRQTASLP